MHVHDRMVRAQIARLERERAMCRFLGAAELAALLQRESVHRQDRVVPRHAGRPVRKGARRAPCRAQRVAHEEIKGVGDRKDDHVERRKTLQRVDHWTRGGVVAREQGLDRGSVAALAVIHGQAMRSAGSLAGRRVIALVAACEQQPGFEMTRCDERRRFLPGCARGPTRITEVAQEERYCALIVLECARGCAGHLIAAGISQTGHVAMLNEPGIRGIAGLFPLTLCPWAGKKRSRSCAGARSSRSAWAGPTK